MEQSVSTRFVNETIAPHWAVTEDPQTFNLLVNHLENKTNFRAYFEEAFERFVNQQNKDQLVIADIGGGVGWTSALMAKHPKVAKVILIEPSENRRKVCYEIAKHFGVDLAKIQDTYGTFEDFNCQEKFDCVVLCASLHHCFDQYIPGLFKNIKKQLKEPAGKAKVLVANEHYVHWPWVLRRMIYYAVYYNQLEEKQFYARPGKWRNPHPFDGEHWRTRKELEDIFTQNGFDAHFYTNKGDLCKKTQSLYEKIEWTYYSAILDLKVSH